MIIFIIKATILICSLSFGNVALFIPDQLTDVVNVDHVRQIHRRQRPSNCVVRNGTDEDVDDTFLGRRPEVKRRSSQQLQVSQLMIILCNCADDHVARKRRATLEIVNFTNYNMHMNYGTQNSQLWPRRRRPTADKLWVTSLRPESNYHWLMIFHVYICILVAVLW